jgi:hypothetical protein
MAKEPERQYREDHTDRGLNEEVEKRDDGSQRPDQDDDDRNDSEEK